MGPIELYFTLLEAEPELFTARPDDGTHVLLDVESIQAAQEAIVDKLKTQGLPAQYGAIGVVFEDQHVMVLRDAVRFHNGGVERTGHCHPVVNGIELKKLCTYRSLPKVRACVKPIPVCAFLVSGQTEL